MRAISVQIEDDEYQRLKALAALAGQSVATLVRQAMAAYLGRVQPQGRSLLSIPAHASGKLLSGWNRGQIYDEMIGG